MEPKLQKTGLKPAPSKAIALIVVGLTLVFILSFFRKQNLDSPPIDFNVKLELFEDENKSLAIESLKDTKKETLFVLWATWCEPCIVELQEIAKNKEDIEEKYKLILVNVDGGYKEKIVPEVKAWLISQDFNLQTYYDFNEVLIKTLGFSSIPFSFSLNQENKISWQNAGILDLDKI